MCVVTAGMRRTVHRALRRPLGLRLASTLRRLQGPGTTSDGRPTVYCTGFLTDTKSTQNWIRRALVRVRHFTTSNLPLGKRGELSKLAVIEL